MSEDPLAVDGMAQAEMIRRREISATQLVEAAIIRIEQTNPALNAVIHPLFDKARATAEKAPAGPFQGVPFLLKDGLAYSAGDPRHEGMCVLRDAGWREATDSVLMARFRAAGLVLCGKTNLPELATSSVTEPLAYGPTRNPWNVERSPGGSSGGSAAAVAAGMVSIAHGSDMGGSIRMPASCCGVVGLKPTRGRTTLAPDHGEYWGPVTHQHVLTRSVRDSAAVLDAVAGPAAGDPYTAPPPQRPFLEEVGAPPGRLRVGVRTARPDGAGATDPECLAAVAEVSRLLDSLGHDVQEAAVPALDMSDQWAAWSTVVAAGLARDLDRWSAKLGRPVRPEELEPHNAFFVTTARSLSAVEYVAAVDDLSDRARRIAAEWVAFDVLLTPTLPCPPLRVGELATETDPLVRMIRLGGLATFTMPFNVTGQPAVSLPLHWSSDGMPIGVQLVAAFGREDVLFRLAAQLEEARPWSGRRPLVQPAHAIDHRAPA